MSAAFQLLAESIQHCLWRMQWNELRPIQSQAIHAILESENDLIISAATASGKTEAAFLPIVSKIAKNPFPSVQAVYVSPLKALINDQFRRLDELCEYAEIPVHRWHGDVGQDQKAKLLKRPAGILLLTPESLESLFINRSSSLNELFAGLEFVVIDELHAFVGRERGTHLRSLLSRLDQRIERSTRKFALSATLGEWESLYAKWLQPTSPDRVQIIADAGGARTIRLKVYGYPHRSFDGESKIAQTLSLSEADFDNESAALAEPMDKGRPPLTKPNEESVDDETEQVCPELLSDLQTCFAGRFGLVFANSRTDVESFADSLNRLNESKGLTRSFLVHHGSVSKYVREETEKLMRGNMPFTTLCSSTLEMGIDIGDVQGVGQIGAPWSVASLIQRLGRSGRRGDRRSEIRIFVTEPAKSNKDADLIDRLHVELIQSIALVELMLEKWLEPPEAFPFDPSTFVQQIMSVLAETGGTNAATLFERIVSNGAFRGFSKGDFMSILRALRDHDVVQQMEGGDLILGLEGERIVKSYEFYSAFASPKELRVVHQARHVGNISISQAPKEGEHLRLAGRRWQVVEFDERTSTISVEPARGRKKPMFSGSEGEIHSKVREKMRSIVLAQTTPTYLSKGAAEWLNEARAAARDAKLDQTGWVELGDKVCCMFTWTGTRTHRTIQWLAGEAGLQGSDRAIALTFPIGVAEAKEKLRQAIAALPTSEKIADTAPAFCRRKYDELLPAEILRRSFIANALNLDEARSCLIELCL